MARKKGATNIATRALKDIIDTCINSEELIGKLVELVRGVSITKMTEEGAKVYTEKPDVGAAKLLLEYRYGKAHQSIEMSGEAITKIVIEKTIIGK